MSMTRTNNEDVSPNTLINKVIIDIHFVIFA